MKTHQIKNTKVAIAFIILAGILLSPFAQSASAAADSVHGDRVYILSVEDAIEQGLSAYMERAFRIIAEDANAQLVILEIDTPGGLVTAAQKIRNSIEGCPLETVALVKGGAISAGTYIAMSCDKIAMQPGTTIGDVEPRVGDEVADEKFLSYWRAEMSSLAEAHGRNKDIAIAMVDRNAEIEGVKKAGQLLTLTTQEAVDVGYCDYVVTGKEEIKAIYGLLDATDMGVEVSTAERIARFVTNPAIAPFILMIGIAGVIIEVFTAGFGIAGIIGGGCLILYFAGHMIAGFPGWGAIVLFAIGLLLMIIEGLIPGFGIPGITGLLCFMASLILVAPSFQIGLQSVVIALVGSAILISLAVRFLSKSKYWDKFSLQQTLGKEGGYISQSEDFSVYVGRRGRTATSLHPAGIVMLDDGKRLDVVSEGGFIEKDQPVVITKTDGPRIIVVQE
ncbi:MAG: ATP-dependent Clp protease proteolytic subunit [Peptococcaceae bacterium]|jgi:membrane-bound serine protease (ClpP class)|nr:ATP-dependent Clp protease proteolytic subunit [Peptococcaceae bacterium]